MKKIQILGTGCPKCRQLLENAERACKALGNGYAVEKVDDINKIIEFGVMMTPAIAVNGTVVKTGKVLSEEEIKQLLTE